MVNILAEILVGNIDTFLDAFTTTGAKMRKKHGCLGSEVFRVSDDGERLLLLFQWESKERYQAFLGDPEVRQTIQSGSTQSVVKVTFLDSLGEYPG